MAGVIFEQDSARRISRVVRDFERGYRNEEVRPGEGNALFNVQTVRVTSTTATSGRYPGRIQVYNAATNTYSDLNAAQDCWVIGANSETLAVQYYPNCRMQGDYTTLPVFKVAATVGAPSGAAPVIRWFTQTADKAVTNTTTETSIIGTGVGSLAIAWQIGTTVRVRGFGHILTNGSQNYTLKLYLGSTLMLTYPTITLDAPLPPLGWNYEAMLTCRTVGAPGTIYVQGQIVSLTGGVVAVANATVGSVTNNVATAIDVKVTWGAAHANNVITSTNTLVETMG